MSSPTPVWNGSFLFLITMYRFFPLRKNFTQNVNFIHLGLFFGLNLFFESNELWDAYLDVQWNSVGNSNCVWAKELIQLVMGSIT